MFTRAEWVLFFGVATTLWLVGTALWKIEGWRRHAHDSLLKDLAKGEAQTQVLNRCLVVMQRVLCP